MESISSFSLAIDRGSLRGTYSCVELRKQATIPLQFAVYVEFAKRVSLPIVTVNGQGNKSQMIGRRAKVWRASNGYSIDRVISVFKPGFRTSDSP